MNFFLIQIINLLIAIVFIGVGFSIGMWELNAAFNSIIHVPGILLWSFFAGNGFIWLIVILILCFYYYKNRNKLFLYGQLVSSLILGISFGAQWVIA
ncbi:hypothetical protein KO525_00020 [Psychrosphaera sp. B3R10]|uniref:hypothetical protein n=1 Tax=unclassified Psychrosphaera TaxID=2641570 RepID=UPI001C08DF00|nr:MULTISPECIES: hypothetical protein [unclassified Psychrosphaera]MBU2883231.1 hypothetical protein [Psychrosphaera sp. I2R16]MBU2987770.1 hypothetical protein [Psychrosphaera sp. B3R10]MDO6721590.1 hypothetical protein [Psychrosphaera sp. 1_MG-2023]